jgi:hypothetical protein
VSISTFHRLTIWTAFAGAVAFTIWAVVQPDWPAMLGGVAATAVIGAYLRNLRARLDLKLGPDGR